jgi:hypothetical protein
MLETILAFVKGLPGVLAHTVEVILVAAMFVFIWLFLFGFYTAIKVVGKKSVKIKEISFIPPRVEFYEEDEG